MTSRGLTPDERRLWRRTMRDVVPLHERPEASVMPNEEPSPMVSGRPSLGSTLIKASHAKPTQSPSPSREDPFQSGDPKVDRRAARGRMTIDATFDLHGHNQASARPALYGFLLEARRRGHRCVLVITGKGAGKAMGDGRSRGVLYQRLRDWLREEDFRQHITRASPAHQKHGGDGACYLFLKSGVSRT